MLTGDLVFGHFLIQAKMRELGHFRCFLMALIQSKSCLESVEGGNIKYNTVGTFVQLARHTGLEQAGGYKK